MTSDVRASVAQPDGWCLEGLSVGGGGGVHEGVSIGFIRLGLIKMPKFWTMLVASWLLVIEERTAALCVPFCLKRKDQALSGKELLYIYCTCPDVTCPDMTCPDVP
jgi:hypothetical protein